MEDIDYSLMNLKDVNKELYSEYKTRFDNLLNKKVLKKYYENLYVLFELTNKILNIVEE